MSYLAVLVVRVLVPCLAISALWTGLAPGPAAAQNQDLAYRLTVLEEQVRQLVGQMQELQHELRQARASGGERGGGGQLLPPPQGGSAPVIGGAPPPADQPLGSTSSFQSYDLQSYDGAQGQQAGQPPPPPSEDATQTIVEMDGDDGERPQTRAPGPKVLGQVPADAVGGVGGGQGSTMEGQVLGPGQVEQGGSGDDGVESAALDGSQQLGTGGSPDQVYERAYDQYVNRQFGEAEAGFRLFLSRHRDHQLAGNAQYWLGETYYVQGKYKDAARNFLNGFQTYPKSTRAPNALLKLGMSLNKLGQKEQACGAFAEVPKKFPSAADARNQALREMKRAGC